MHFMKQPPVLSEALLEDLRRYIDAYYIDEHLFVKADKFLSAKYSVFQQATETQECYEAAMPMLASPKRRPAEPNELRDVLKAAESSFSEHLVSLLSECGEKDSVIYRRAEISRQLFHKILNKKDYQPTKSTAIQLALGLRLDLAGTQTLLGKAGYALTRSSKTDLVVQYFIERKEYSIVTINAALYDCGLPLLKTGSAV